MEDKKTLKICDKIFEIHPDKIIMIDKTAYYFNTTRFNDNEIHNICRDLFTAYEKAYFEGKDAGIQKQKQEQEIDITSIKHALRLILAELIGGDDEK